MYLRRTGKTSQTRVPFGWCSHSPPHVAAPFEKRGKELIASYEKEGEVDLGALGPELLGGEPELKPGENEKEA